MTFEAFVIAVCDRFVSQRTFELIVEPALADLAFESAAGRRSWIANHAAVVRATAGAVQHEMQRSSGGFLKLTLLSACYYAFPVFVSVRIFKSWTDFLIAASVALVLSLVPVMVCFWPSRYPVRRVE